MAGAAFFTQTLLSWNAAPPTGATASAPVSMLMPRPPIWDLFACTDSAISTPRRTPSNILAVSVVSPLTLPSVIYLIVGIVMLKPGWMNRYLPPVAIELVPDVAFIFGFVWAGLMFFSAALNLIVALNFNVVTWSAFMSIYGIVSKAALFLIGYATMRTIGVRRRRAQMALAQS